MQVMAGMFALQRINSKVMFGNDDYVAAEGDGHQLPVGASAQLCTNEGCDTIQVMADVFALQRIQNDVMFRNDDYVAAEKVKAINRLLEHLRMEMRSVAVPLVDAFNIPDHILRSPIGLQSQDYSSYVEVAGWSPVM